MEPAALTIFRYGSSKQALRIKMESAEVFGSAYALCRREEPSVRAFTGIHRQHSFGAAMNKGLTSRWAEDHMSDICGRWLERSAWGHLSELRDQSSGAIDRAPEMYRIFPTKRSVAEVFWIRGR